MNPRKEIEKSILLYAEGAKGGFSFTAAYHWVTKVIDEHYEIYCQKLSSKEKEQNEKSLKTYHQSEWYTKLKILTGLKIPTLARKYTWN